MPRTISAWFRANQGVVTQSLVNQSGEYDLGIVSGGQLRFWENEWILTSDIRFDDGLWHNVVVASPGRVYVDNDPVPSHRTPGVPPVSGLSPPIREGLVIDQVAIWNRVLTRDEIRQVYNGGEATVDPRMIAGDALVGWYSLGDSVDGVRGMSLGGLDASVRTGDIIGITGASSPEHNGEFVIANVSHTISHDGGSDTRVMISPGTFRTQDGRLFSLDEPVTVEPGDPIKLSRVERPEPRTSWERILDDDYL